MKNLRFTNDLKFVVRNKYQTTDNEIPASILFSGGVESECQVSNRWPTENKKFYLTENEKYNIDLGQIFGGSDLDFKSYGMDSAQILGGFTDLSSQMTENNYTHIAMAQR